MDNVITKEKQSAAGEKAVIIAGASSGIGLRCAWQFIEKGCKVYNISRHKCELSQVINLEADCSKPEEIRAAVEKAAADTAVDIAVYCAGYSVASPLPETESADYRYLFEVNFFGAVEFIQAAVPHMTRGGTITLISSMAGILPIPYQSFYNASKAALKALALSLNLELNEKNIKVTAVLPGGTKTPFTSKRKVYTPETADRENFYNAVNEVNSSEQSGDDACAVASEIVKNVFKKEPKAVLVTGLKNKARAAAASIMSDKMKLDAISKKYKQEQPYN